MAQGKAPVLVRLVRVYREKGLGGVWFGTLSRVGYRRLVLLERRLDEPVARVSPRADVEVRVLRHDDEAAFEVLGQGDAGVFRSRLQAGHQCWGAWCAGGLRHVAWLAFREVRVEYLSCRLLLDDDVAYVYRAFTQPSFRRLGLGPATQAVCLRTLHEKGCRLVLAAVLPDNPWAYPPWLMAGYRRIGVVRALGAGRRGRIFVSLDGRSASPTGWRFESRLDDGPLERDDSA